MAAGSVHPMATQDKVTAFALDETDLAIVHALQIQPRAPWTLVGEVLDIDPVTAARRWNRLRDAGAAWVDAYLSAAHHDASRAQVEIMVDGARVADVAQELAGDRGILSLKLTSGARDLLAIVVAPDLEAMAEYLTERVSLIPGVRATRPHVVTAAPFEGSRWRLRSLSPDQQARMRPEPGPVPSPEPLRDFDRRVARALSDDGRIPLADLANVVGSSVATTRRSLRRLVDSGRLSLHCTLARPLTGWPVSAVYFASVPAEHLDAAAAALRTLPELRLCTITAGPYNLILDVWLRALHDVHVLEAHLSRELGGLHLRIMDRAVVLRTYKHIGHILDRRGHSIRTVPTDPAMSSRP
jgi:DNA-binding Lrp family transcriptional regulator